MASNEPPRGSNWSVDDTEALIECWAEDSIERELSGTHRNRHVYEKIAKALGERGIERTWESCRTKIKGLRSTYLKAKDNNNTSGQSRSGVMFFDKMDEFLGCKPLTEPQNIEDTGAEEEVAPSQEKPGDRKAERGKGKKRSIDETIDTFMNEFVKMEERQTKLFIEHEAKRRKEEEELEERRIESERKFQLQLLEMQSRAQMQMISLVMGNQQPNFNFSSPGFSGDQESGPIRDALDAVNFYSL